MYLPAHHWARIQGRNTHAHATACRVAQEPLTATPCVACICQQSQYASIATAAALSSGSACRCLSRPAHLYKNQPAVQGLPSPPSHTHTHHAHGTMVQAAVPKASNTVWLNRMIHMGGCKVLVDMSATTTVALPTSRAHPLSSLRKCQESAHICPQSNRMASTQAHNKPWRTHPGLCTAVAPTQTRLPCTWGTLTAAPAAAARALCTPCGTYACKAKW
jgi:hypothetical protein